MEGDRPRGAKTGIVYQFVKRRILEGTYLPGHRLILDDLSRELDVSQLPVREALRRLEAEGYVTYRHNQGARVAEPDSSAYESTQYVISVLEGAATACAAPLITADRLSRARELNEAMRVRREQFDIEGFMELNEQFHDLICEPCPNIHLFELLKTESSRMALIRRPTLGIVMRHSQEFIDDHDRLLTLIEQDPSSSEIQILAQAHKRRMLYAVQSETLSEGSSGS